VQLVAIPRFFEPAAYQGELGVGAGVEEVGRLQVRIALRVVGVGGVNVGRELDVRSPGEIIPFRFYIQAEFIITSVVILG
jgi:hypothetical protein